MAGLVVSPVRPSSAMYRASSPEARMPRRRLSYQTLWPYRASSRSGFAIGLLLTPNVPGGGGKACQPREPPIARARTGPLAGRSGGGRPTEDAAEDVRDHPVAAPAEEDEGGLGSRSRPGVEPIPERQARSMEAHLDRLLGGAEGERRIGGRHPLDLAQHEHAAVEVGELVDGLLHHVAELPVRRPLLRILRLRAHALVLLADLVDRRQARLPAGVPQCLVQRDAGDPGGEGGGPLVLAEMRVGVEPGLLHRVLALVVSPQHRSDGAEHALVVSAASGPRRAPARR